MSKTRFFSSLSFCIQPETVQRRLDGPEPPPRRAVFFVRALGILEGDNLNFVTEYGGGQKIKCLIRN